MRFLSFCFGFLCLLHPSVLADHELNLESLVVSPGSQSLPNLPGWRTAHLSYQSNKELYHVNVVINDAPEGFFAIAPDQRSLYFIMSNSSQVAADSPKLLIGFMMDTQRASPYSEYETYAHIDFSASGAYLSEPISIDQPIQKIELLLEKPLKDLIQEQGLNPPVAPALERSFYPIISGIYHVDPTSIRREGPLLLQPQLRFDKVEFGEIDWLDKTIQVFSTKMKFFSAKKSGQSSLEDL